MTCRRLLPLALAVAIGASPAAPALAQGGGVTIEPGSPSGKEYAIPLESARRDAARGGGDEVVPTQQGERSAPLFGEGVGDDDDGRAETAPSGGSGSKGTAPDRGSKQGSERPERAAGGGGGVQDAITGTRTVRASVPDGGLGSAATIGAVALSVLLLGGVLGSIARRRNAG